MKGYMTVEASLVIPMVFGMVVFILSLLFYSYDRCLLEQDVMTYVVRSVYLDGDSVEEKTQSLEAELRNWYRDKYVWMDISVRELMIKADAVELKAEGSFQGPFFESALAKRQMVTWSPTFWIRQKIKLEEQLQDWEDTDEHGVY